MKLHFFFGQRKNITVHGAYETVVDKAYKNAIPDIVYERTSLRCPLIVMCTRRFDGAIGKLQNWVARKTRKRKN